MSPVPFFMSICITRTYSKYTSNWAKGQLASAAWHGNEKDKQLDSIYLMFSYRNPNWSHLARGSYGVRYVIAVTTVVVCNLQHRLSSSSMCKIYSEWNGLMKATTVVLIPMSRILISKCHKIWRYEIIDIQIYWSKLCVILCVDRDTLVCLFFSQ